jgi:hypothetical protein
MTSADLFKLLHVAAAFWLTAGILGRWVTQQQAARSSSVQQVLALMPAAAVFERVMVIPGSMVVLLVGLITAWLQGWPILGFLQGGSTNWVLVSLLLTLSLIPVVVLVFMPRGKIFDAALEEAVREDRVTPALSAAFNDPTVRAWHIYEMAAIAVVIVLMVLKPF